jgi:hypothetical protein
VDLKGKNAHKTKTPHVPTHSTSSIIEKNESDIDEDGEGIQTTLPSLSTRLGFHYLPYVSPTQEAHVERYFSLRYRYPPSPVIDLGDANTALQSGGSDRVTELIGGLPPLFLSNQADLLDSPVPVSRFASVSLESCFNAAKYPQRVPTLVRLVRSLIPLAFDRLLVCRDSTVWSKEAAYMAQRVLDAAAETCFSLQVSAGMSSFSDIDCAFDEACLDPFASKRSSMSVLPHSSPSLSDMVEYSVMAHAHCFRKLKPECRPLVSALIDLFAAIPAEALVHEDIKSRNGLWPDGSGGSAEDPNTESSSSSSSSSSVPTGALLCSAGLYPTRIRLRRAAMARVCGQLVVPASLVCFLTGALCCADAEFAGVSDDFKKRLGGQGSNSEASVNSEAKIPNLDRRMQESLHEERASLSLLLEQISSPTLAAAIAAGRQVVQDSMRLKGALRMAERAAQAHTKVVSITGLSSSSLSPAAVGFSAFVSYMDSACVTTNGLETTECTSEAAIAIARRVSRLLLYADADPSGHGFGLAAFTAPSAGLVDADPNTRALLASTVIKLSTLSATAASAPGHLSGGTAAAAQHLLRLLLLHPQASVRRAAYSASARILSRPEIISANINYNTKTSAPMAHALLGSCGEKALAVAAASGVADCDAGVRSVAASFLARALRSSSTSTNSLSSLLIRDACTCALAQSESALNSDDIASLRKEIANQSSSSDLLSVIRALFDPNETVRLNASTLALQRVARQEISRSNVESDKPLPVDLETDPAVFLSTLYTLTDANETISLPLHPISHISVLLPEDNVGEDLVTAQRQSALSEYHPYRAGINSHESHSKQPDALIVPLDPSPAALSVLLLDAQKRARPTRFETAIAFAGQQLPQLEELLQAPSGTMPLEAKASTAEQLAHVLLASAPVPIHVQARLGEHTIDIVAACTRSVLDAHSKSQGTIASTFNDYSRDGSAETKDESMRRFIGALGVLFEAISSVSSACRARIRHEEPLQQLLLELLYFGGPPLQNVPKRIVSLDRKSAANPAPAATDARLCALRTLARSVFEAGVTDSPVITDTASDTFGPHLDRTPVFSRFSGAFVNDAAGSRCAVTSVLVDVVTWNSRPLLRSQAFWGGPSALVPAVATDPSVRRDNFISNPTLLSAFLVACGAKGVVKAPLHLNSKHLRKNKAKSKALEMESVSLSRSYSSSQIATDLIRLLSSAHSHESYISSLNFAKETCLSDKSGCVSLALLSVRHNERNDKEGEDREQQTKGDSYSSSTSALLAALSKILRGGQPTSDEDRFALAATFEFLAALLSSFNLPRHPLDEDDEESAELEGEGDACASRLSHLFPPNTNERSLIDAVCKEAAQLLRDSIALSDIEVSIGDEALTRHLSNREVNNEDGKSQDRLNQIHGLSDTDSKIGRAEMLADSLRISEYHLLDCDVSISHRGLFFRSGLPSSSSSSLKATSQRRSDNQRDICFSPSRSCLLSASLKFATSASLSGVGGALFADGETGDDGAPSSYGRSGIAATAMHCITLLQHPLAGFKERLQSVRLLRALIIVCDPTAASFETSATIRFKTLQDSNSIISIYSAAIRSLVRSCTSSTSPALDSFQHKGLLRESLRCLLFLSSLRATSLVENRMRSSDWCDRSSNGSFGWIWRICSDREAGVRANAYKLIAKLIASKKCFAALANEVTPAAHLMQLVANSVRHATATVVSRADLDPLGTNQSPAAAATAHDDTWDAEAPIVRVACAEVVASFAKASSLLMIGKECGATEKLPLNTLLHTLDFEARVRLALRNLGKMQQSQCISRSGDVTAALLFATLSVTEAETAEMEEDTLSSESNDLSSLDSEGERGENVKVNRIVKNVSHCRILHSLLADPQARNGLLVACGAGEPPLCDLLECAEDNVKSIGQTSSFWNAEQSLYQALHGGYSSFISSSSSSSSSSTSRLKNQKRLVTWSTREGARAAQYRVARSAIQTRTVALKLFRKYLALDVPSLPLRLRRFHAQAALGLGVSAVVDSAAALKKSSAAALKSISLPFSVEVALREGCLFVAAVLNAWEESVPMDSDSFSSSRHHPLVFFSNHTPIVSSTSIKLPAIESKNPGSPSGGSPKRNASAPTPLTKALPCDESGSVLLTLNGSSTKRATQLLASSLAATIALDGVGFDVRLAGAQAVCALASSLRLATEVDEGLCLKSRKEAEAFAFDPVGFLLAASPSDKTLTSSTAALSTGLLQFLLELSGDSRQGADEKSQKATTQLSTFSMSLFSGSNTVSTILDESLNQNLGSHHLANRAAAAAIDSSLSVVSSVRGAGGKERRSGRDDSASSLHDASTVLSIDSGFEARELSTLPHPYVPPSQQQQQLHSTQRNNSIPTANSSSAFLDVSKVAGASPSLIEAGQIMQSVFRPTNDVLEGEGKNEGGDQRDEDLGMYRHRSALLGEVNAQPESQLSIDAFAGLELDRLRALNVNLAMTQSITVRLGGCLSESSGGHSGLLTFGLPNIISEMVRMSQAVNGNVNGSSVVGINKVSGSKTNAVVRGLSSSSSKGSSSSSSLSLEATFPVTSAPEVASRLTALSVARTIVSKAAAALLECGFSCSVISDDETYENGFLVSVGRVASDALVSEAKGAHLLLRLILHIRRACSVLRQIDVDVSSQKCSKVAALLMALQASDALKTALRVLTAALLPRPPIISASAAAAMQLDVGGVLRECLESAAFLSRLASSTPRPDSISNCAMSLVSSVAHAAINICGSSEELSSSLVFSGFLSLCISESSFITSVCLKAGLSQNANVPLHVSSTTSSCVGYFAKSFGGSTAAMQRLNDELCSCLIAASSTSPHCRRAIVQKGLVNSISEILQKRLSPPNSLHLLQHLPLRAIEQALNVLASLVVPTVSLHNEDASIAVLKAGGLLDALERLILLHIPLHTTSSSQQQRQIEDIKLALANSRIAASALLSSLASLHGRDEWAARPDLLKAIVAASSDATVDVCGNAVLTLLELSKQPSSRVRVALRDADVEKGLQTALSMLSENKNNMEKDDDRKLSIQHNIEEIINRLQL